MPSVKTPKVDKGSTYLGSMGGSKDGREGRGIDRKLVHMGACKPWQWFGFTVNAMRKY